MLIALFAPGIALACTGFGAMTKTGTIIGKNRDYFYYPQKFVKLQPIDSLNHWMGNPYHHRNDFFALTGIADSNYELNAAEDVSMGVNEHGLTVIEEDTLRPKLPTKQRRFYQPENGTDVNTILYAILQNFNSVDEMLPYLSKIFGSAAPDFYQFADGKKILTVEVAFGDNNQSPTRKFSYQVLSKKNEYFGHTNTYLTPIFIELNHFNQQDVSVNSIDSAESRLEKINDHLLNTENINIESTSKWFLDTRSSVSDSKHNVTCLNTSLFRSDLKGLKSIDMNHLNKAAGSVSTMIVENNGDFKKSYLYLKMLDSITTDKNSNQLIKYKELNISLEKLFHRQKLNFVERQFMRFAPINGTCN